MQVPSMLTLITQRSAEPPLREKPGLIKAVSGSYDEAFASTPGGAQAGAGAALPPRALSAALSGASRRSMRVHGDHEDPGVRVM